ncbi:MAG TPA: beta-ketoacyl reductase, partial [Ktedonobacteraceae bacterium]
SVLQDTPLDFFVSFSSGASLFGSAAQGNYAAASEFLDVLASHQRAHGRSAISIDWGAVSEIGYGATADGQRVHEYWESRGIHRITPGQVLTALELLIPQVVARVGVIRLDWHLLREFFPQIAHFPLVRYLLAEAEAGAPSQNGAGGVVSSSTLPRIQDALPAERQQLMISYLCEQLAGVLRVSAHRLDTEQPLTALGLDSLMAIELKNRIERELQVRIPIVTFLQGPSITQFAGQVLEQIAAPPVAEPALAVVAADRGQEAADAQRLLSQLDRLSDTEVDTLLAQMLQDDQHQPDEKTNGVSAQDAEQLLSQLDQLSDKDVDSLLSQMVQEEDE